MNHSRKICVLGLGYVGLPALVAFSKMDKVIGFDIDKRRVAQLQKGIDYTNELEKGDLDNPNLFFTHKLEDIKDADFFIVAVPTPVDEAKHPDLSYLVSSSEMVGKVLKEGDIVVYESTVYPGATEEVCLPILERESGLSCDKHFGLGYSPERINPGDREHTFTNTKKIVSASNPQTLKVLESVYSSVVNPGVHSAATIKVAEAAKIMENTQRDLNVSLMNEFALIFDKMKIDTLSVIEAASSKWNFLKFSPGLVGGHCIGVDPYYLTYKSDILGHTPQVILSGRRINDGMGKFIAEKSIKLMIQAGHDISKSRVTILGLTFKENCPDIRNTRVIDVVRELNTYGIEVQVHDDWADKDEAYHEYGIKLLPKEDLRPANSLIFAVQHGSYGHFNLDDFQKLTVPKAVILDVKGICPKDLLQNHGYHVWRL